MNKIITKQQQQQQKSLYSNTSLPADQQMPKEVPVLWLTKESWNAAGSCASSGSTSTQLKVGGCLTRLLPDGPDSSAWITGQRIPSVREELVHRLPAACFFFFFFSKHSCLLETSRFLPDVLRGRAAGRWLLIAGTVNVSELMDVVLGGARLNIPRDWTPPGSTTAVASSWQSNLPSLPSHWGQYVHANTHKATTSLSHSRLKSFGNPPWKEKSLHLPCHKPGSRAKGNRAFLRPSKDLREVLN